MWRELNLGATARRRPASSPWVSTARYTQWWRPTFIEHEETNVTTCMSGGGLLCFCPFYCMYTVLCGY